jgi:Zn-dependent protease
MLFNLIPLAPLDGEKIAAYFLPDAWQGTLDQIRPYGPMILLGLFVLGPYLGLDVLSWILGPPFNFLLSILVG